MNNTFGSIFSMTSFGESHGPAMGVVIQGCPSGVVWDESLITENLERRRPGFSKTASPRKEQDEFKLLSGVFEGKTLGTPIALAVENTNTRSQDYEKIKNQPRIGHADELWKGKYSVWDYRGGGRSSGRETVSRVLAGSVAQMFCQHLSPEVKVGSKIISYGPHSFTDYAQFESDIIKYKEQFDSVGGIVELTIDHAPAFLGQPVFRKFKSDLAQAFLSVGATNGVDFGGGFELSHKTGLEFHKSDGPHYGGIRGGLTTGEPIRFRINFKPTSSVGNTSKEGRHDPCIIPRALVVLEAMAWLVLADHMLLRRLDQV